MNHDPGGLHADNPFSRSSSATEFMLAEMADDQTQQMPNDVFDPAQLASMIFDGEGSDAVPPMDVNAFGALPPSRHPGQGGRPTAEEVLQHALPAHGAFTSGLGVANSEHRRMAPQTNPSFMQQHAGERGAWAGRGGIPPPITPGLWPHSISAARTAASSGSASSSRPVFPSGLNIELSSRYLRAQPTERLGDTGFEADPEEEDTSRPTSARTPASRSNSVAASERDGGGTRTVGKGEKEPSKKDMSDRRREERNRREQRRSNQISRQIDELKDILAGSGWRNIHQQSNKFTILRSAAEYIQDLQHQNRQLHERRQMLSSTQAMTREGGAQPGASPRHGVVMGAHGEVNFHLVFHKAGVPMALANTDGILVDCNVKFSEITRISRDNLVHQSMFGLVLPEDLQQTYSWVAHILHQRQTPVDMCIRRSTIRRETEPLVVSIAPVRDDSQRPILFHVSLMDSGP